MPFSKLGLTPELVKAVRAMGFSDPTAIQARAIPEALAGRDIVGCSQTGSGKTAAFVLPIMQLLAKGDGRQPVREGAAHGGHRNAEKGRAPRALVLSPTRELCAQVETMARDMGRFSKISVGAVYGGVPVPPQQKMLAAGVDLLVATPGRLLDLQERKNVDLSQVRTLVLDEGDRLLDMGFMPDVRRILNLLPRQRQNMLFSATMPPEIQRLVDNVLREPVTIEIGVRRAPATGVTQIVYPVMPTQKVLLLVELLKRREMESVLIFCRTKHGADKVAAQLHKLNYAVARLHSNRTQQQREAALKGFRSGRYEILVATDVASRGLDIIGISHVVNYDVPQYAEDYVHRVGRTARADASGDAITLVTPDDRRALAAIEQYIGAKIPQGSVIGFNYEPLPAERSEGERLVDFARGAKKSRRPSRRTGRQQWGARR